MKYNVILHYLALPLRARDVVPVRRHHRQPRVPAAQPHGQAAPRVVAKYSTLFGQLCEIYVFPSRACKNSPKQPPIYFRRGYNMASMPHDLLLAALLGPDDGTALQVRRAAAEDLQGEPRVYHYLSNAGFLQKWRRI